MSCWMKCHIVSFFSANQGLEFHSSQPWSHVTPPPALCPVTHPISSFLLSSPLLCCLSVNTSPVSQCCWAKKRNTEKGCSIGDGGGVGRESTEAWDGKASGFCVRKPSCEFFTSLFLSYLSLVVSLPSILTVQYLLCVLLCHPCFFFLHASLPPYHKAGCWCCLVMPE